MIPVDIEGLHRTETYMTTRKILREVILNAIAHKFYPSCVPIKVKVFEDHITVKNEGFWPFEDLKVEDAYNGEHSTYQTNPLIDHGLYMSGVMDTWGQGFGLIRAECEKTNAPLPGIKATEKTVTVTIHAATKYDELLGKTLGETEKKILTEEETKINIDMDSLRRSGLVADISLDRLYEIIRYCNEPRTRNELMDFCGYKSSAHFRTNVLNPLLSGGQIELTIPDKPSSPKQRYLAKKII